MTHVERITPIVKIKFKTLMLNSSLCDYSDAYILVRGTISVASASPPPPAANSNNNDEEVVFKNCAPFF